MKIENQTMLARELQEPCKDVLKQKYLLPHESTIEEVRARVAKGLGADALQEHRFIEALTDGFTPAGRINRAIGAENITTAMNCFVQGVGDSMSGVDDEGQPGIMVAVTEAVETMRRGGGVGYDFSSIRPKGARVMGTHSNASGPVSFMRIFDAACEAVESAGERRGAQMAMLRVDHPDVMDFIDSKKAPDFQQLGLTKAESDGLYGLMREKGMFGYAMRRGFARFSNFNISVTVTDEFMAAVNADADFDLVHKVPPADRDDVQTKVCADGVTRFIYRTVKAREIWEQIMRNTYDGAEPGVMFIDTINKNNNLRAIEEIRASNPCGEQMLPAYGCCDLGSILLSKAVDNPFTPDARFNFEKLRELAATGVELLDRVLDVTPWPLEKQKQEAMNKRRVGLGFLGLGNALAMLGVRYDSKAGVEMGAEIAKQLCYAAYRKSIDLAKLYGPFPLFNADQYLEEGTFASRLPDDIKADIRKFGIRNSHLLSIAPTGTISMAIGDNSSGGIEPIFALSQTRKVRQNGGQKVIQLLDASYRMFLDMHGPDADASMFVTAEQMSVDDHLNMVAAVAPFIDSAISKTINVPADYPFDDFKKVYQKAYALGIKGITTYRPNDMMGSVLESADKKPGAEASANSAGQFRTDDPDRRIELKSVKEFTKALRWPNRPETPMGTPALTYSVKHEGGDFAVSVGYQMKDKAEPLEVFVMGNEQPRGLAAIAKVMSLDMRSGDAGWLKMKLESLAGTVADDAFEMNDPFTGKRVMTSSLVSGYARLVEHALTSINAFENNTETHMVDSLFSAKEPKTESQGARTWSFDIRNDVTQDDFMMTIKEASMPNGQVRPLSVWLSGKYPRVLDGLTKVLSIDMRISDTAWVVMKLKKLLTFGEQRGDFLARVPGEQGMQNYPSTVAYMAALLLDRYRVLGLIDKDLELMHGQSKPGLPTTDAEAKEPVLKFNGMQCPACNSMTLHKRDGCKVCENCGHTGECG